MFLLDTQYLTKLYEVISETENVLTFLHNTRSKQIAEEILKQGFEFQGYLDYTTDMVSAKDPIGIKYFSQIRKAYGNYTIIIQISKEIIESYTQKIAHTDIHFSEVLAINTDEEGIGEDAIHCLAPHFIKGYLNVKTAKFISNENFNPSLKIEVFEENMKKILGQLSHKE